MRVNGGSSGEGKEEGGGRGKDEEEFMRRPPRKEGKKTFPIQQQNLGEKRRERNVGVTKTTLREKALFSNYAMGDSEERKVSRGGGGGRVSALMATRGERERERPKSLKHPPFLSGEPLLPPPPSSGLRPSSF